MNTDIIQALNSILGESKAVSKPASSVDASKLFHFKRLVSELFFKKKVYEYMRKEGIMTGKLYKEYYAVLHGLKLLSL